MYIQKVKLQNFRSFGDEGICFLFNKGINAVIGENNNGKTALIDAIRIAFSCVLYTKADDCPYIRPWLTIFHYECPQFVYGDIRQSVSGGVFRYGDCILRCVF